MSEESKKKVKKIKELFVEDLARIQGGTGQLPVGPKCPEITTLACNEERPGCGC